MYLVNETSCLSCEWSILWVKNVLKIDLGCFEEKPDKTRSDFCGSTGSVKFRLKSLDAEKWQHQKLFWMNEKIEKTCFHLMNILHEYPVRNFKLLRNYGNTISKPFKNPVNFSRDNIQICLFSAYVNKILNISFQLYGYWPLTQWFGK